MNLVVWIEIAGGNSNQFGIRTNVDEEIDVLIAEPFDFVKTVEVQVNPRMNIRRLAFVVEGCYPLSIRYLGGGVLLPLFSVHVRLRAVSVKFGHEVWAPVNLAEL